jgi:hypothetical protein
LPYLESTPVLSLGLLPNWVRVPVLSSGEPAPHDHIWPSLTIPIGEIREEQVAGLIASQAPESLLIEYTRETYRGNDEQRKEFLADVSSFANSQGGDLIIGMVADQSFPGCRANHGSRGRSGHGPLAAPGV